MAHMSLVIYVPGDRRSPFWTLIGSLLEVKLVLAGYLLYDGSDAIDSVVGSLEFGCLS